jgi:hypothetical protein
LGFRIADLEKRPKPSISKTEKTPNLAGNRKFRIAIILIFQPDCVINQVEIISRMSRKNIHIMPRPNGWAIVKEGSKRASAVHNTKAKAEAFGKEKARKDNVDLIIHAPIGRFTQYTEIDSRKTIDPRPPADFVTSLRQNNLRPQDKARKWREWAASHSRKKQFLSDEAVSRESIYGEHG